MIKIIYLISQPTGNVLEALQEMFIRYLIGQDHNSVTLPYYQGIASENTYIVFIKIALLPHLLKHLRKHIHMFTNIFLYIYKEL